MNKSVYKSPEVEIQMFDYAGFVITTSGGFDNGDDVPAPQDPWFEGDF